MILLLITLLHPILVVQGFQNFQAKIPNGVNVVDSEGEAWPGVGHLRRGGGGERNPFGKDFKIAGFEWTTDLCNKDSDGDGRTNGEELGDPQCLWEEGDIPQFDKGITHPGFVNAGSVHSMDPCKDHQLPDGAKTASFTFPDYAVMSKDTSYIKKSFTFPEEGDMIRFDIIVDQPSVVHHMILYKCTTDVSDEFGTPSEGNMPCSDVIFAWAVGGKDYCLPHDLGMSMKANGLYMALEIHYDNPKLITGIRDNSGLRVHYVPGSTLTPSSWLWVGASIPTISIPPEKENYEIHSVCDLGSLGTRNTVTIKVFASIMHGHKLARKIWVTKYNKDSMSETDLACNTNYDFDLQEMVPLETEIEVSTRDVLTVHCVYDSTSKDTVTHGGDATYEEMCIGLFMFHPQLPGVPTIKCWNTAIAQGDGNKKCYSDTSDTSDITSDSSEMWSTTGTIDGNDDVMTSEMWSITGTVDNVATTRDGNDDVMTSEMWSSTGTVDNVATTKDDNDNNDANSESDDATSSPVESKNINPLSSASNAPDITGPIDNAATSSRVQTFISGYIIFLAMVTVNL